ncbi:hypothetical protein LOTGIDRAFT_170151 [Lottia gigantea]|uniref:JmjC domain-containing protein n=1 Tax=Lottia gigantea TaxID=225164 RepID=V3YW46_LOTGI|nr:hypothetical protein LOTGIDRAFT_170151 [Lottia gigantea]ESO82238.1 hypothetical protein LOTGIDRAFT_170151 [Lottia gigantea]
MDVQTLTNVLFTLISSLFSCVTLYEGSDTNHYLAQEYGHLKPFGSGRPIHNVETIAEFPDPITFNTEYFTQQKPVLIQGGAKISPAFDLWTDDYFLKQDLQKPVNISVETLKKEVRGQNMLEMDFKEFVKIYPNSTYYMVDLVPEFIQKDLVLPFSLQCPDLMGGGIDEVIMWLSGGGTSSVVHSDPSDNLNCVYRGTKDFIIVDPLKYGELVPFDSEDQSHSLLDVDKADYVKYPGLAKVEFIHAHLEPGDCLYIPASWIHQVRSYNINLAVNIWWSNLFTQYIDTDTCLKQFDQTITLDKLEFAGIGKPLLIRYWLLPKLSSRSSKSISESEMIDSLNSEFLFGLRLQQKRLGAIEDMYKKLFKKLDENNDGLVTIKEFMKIPPKQLERYDVILHYTDKLRASLDPKVLADEYWKITHYEF